MGQTFLPGLPLSNENASERDPALEAKLWPAGVYSPRFEDWWATRKMVSALDSESSDRVQILAGTLGFPGGASGKEPAC